MFTKHITTLFWFINTNKQFTMIENMLTDIASACYNVMVSILAYKYCVHSGPVLFKVRSTQLLSHKLKQLTWESKAVQVSLWRHTELISTLFDRKNSLTVNKS